MWTLWDQTHLTTLGGIYCIIKCKCFKTYVKELLVTTISQSLGAFGFITLGLSLAGLKSSLKFKK